jgi:hypothetical protein
MDIKIFLFCPIPENQKPIHDLINENDLINEIQNGFLFFFSFLCFFCFSKNFFILTFFILTFLNLLFFRWSQLENRFNDSRLFYEEGSWYDGQIWEKPFFLIKNDRLLTSQKIQPIIQRISKTILLILLILILSILSLGRFLIL